MRDIEWRGTFDVSGYGIWGRKMVKVLLESGKYRIRLVSVRGRLPVKDELFHLQDTKLNDPIKVENLIPTFAPVGGKTGFCTCTELRKPPQEQIDNLEKANFVIALSNFSTKAYKSVVSNPEKVHTVSFPMFRGEYNPYGKRIKLEGLEDKFVFLTVGRIDVRKNLETLIKCFSEEFGDNKNVVLILKIYSPDYCIPLWIKQQNPSDNILWLSERIPEMDYLYRSVQCYVATDLGEAWGGPTQEAMLCGIPTIAPKHSGHLDYMNAENSWQIEVSGWKPIGVREDNRYARLLPPDAQVKYPLEDSIKSKMIDVYEEFKGMERIDVLKHPKIQQAVATQKLVDAGTILKQFNDAFDWVEKNVQ